MFTVTAISKGQAFAVEYARFCGSRCECVGFGVASAYDERRARSIAAMLRRLGYGTRVAAA